MSSLPYVVDLVFAVDVIHIVVIIFFFDVVLDILLRMVEKGRYFIGSCQQLYSEM